MRELTIEEKAQAYDKALGRAKALYDKGAPDSLHLEEMFPVLKESKDEGIRNFLISKMKEVGNVWKEYSAKDIIAWLEKQKSVSEIVERYKKSWYNEGKIDGKYEGITDDVKYQQGWHDALEKQSEQNLPSINERAWLYLVSDVLTWESGLGQYLDDPRVQKLAKDLCSEYAQKLYNFPISSNSSNIENNKQEPADKNKTEPKFHEGDWVVFECGEETRTLQIKEIIGKEYVFADGTRLDVVDEDSLHLWTINDAKDGDVLATDKGGIFIYAKTLYSKPYAYCGVDKFGVFKDNCLNNNWANSVDNIHPATKEQRDLLFTKMKEAGYKWDAEKKELKLLITNGGDFGFELGNCEQKPVLSEEDEHKIKDIVYFLNTAKKHYASTVELDACIEWLKSLKERVQLQPKQEWNELLEKFRQAVYDCAWGKVTCKPEGETKEEYVNRWTERFLLIVRNWADGYEVKKSDENKIKGK